MAILQRSVSKEMRRLALAVFAVFFLVRGLGADDFSVRYLRFDEVSETLNQFAGAGFGGTEIKESSAWDRWIRARDAEIRARVDQGVEDSISNLILYGTSFTSRARLDSVDTAASEDGELTEAVRRRIHALALALLSPSAARNERLRFVRDYFWRKNIATEKVESSLSENLRRFISEQRGYQKKLQDAETGNDPTAVFLTRGTLFEARGLSVDTSLLPNFALEDTLHSLIIKGVLTPDRICRIAVIGPGLDFTDKRDGYDFYPLQTLQPFAVLEAVSRIGAGKSENIELVTLDLNAAVNAHISGMAERGRAGHSYVVQLPRSAMADWSPQAISYWEHFGELIGSPVKPLLVPPSLSGVTVRAVVIRPRYAARVRALDLDIVAQTMDPADGGGFDLVVATNILVYYDRLQQALAMASIAHMMNSGGIFLANNVLPAQHVPELEYLGRRSISYSPIGAYGDDVVVYRRR